MAPSIADTSASYAVWIGPKDFESWARASPPPVASLVMIHPIPADFLKDPSVHACSVSKGSSGGAQAVRSLGRGLILSRVCPSLTKRPFPDAPRNHGDMRRRDESSSARGGRRARLGASRGAASAEASSRSRLLSRVGPVGGVYHTP
jgi:hypothetical protein